MIKKLLLVVIINLILIGIWWIDSSNNLLSVYYLDIGQGDSVLVRTPDRKYMIIDGGPDNTILGEIGEILPFWVRKIDIVIVTHPDTDHIGGLVDFISRYDVDTIIFNDIVFNSVLFREFKIRIQEYEISTIHPVAGNELQLGCCVKLDVLWPDSLEQAEKLGSNDSSVTVILNYGEVSMFMGGDLPIEYEEDAVENENIDVDILKLGHHGSRTSTSEKFLAKIKPEVAIISCGADNKFGHPHQEVIDIVDEHGAKIYRTDISGRVKVSSDGKEYWIETKL